ncbi:MAG: hypothetical protein IJI73_08490 [Kiritimatiellae bacterium]|nr:hypothetical protein [Kiritimatiellia bacterium]
MNNASFHLNLLKQTEKLSSSPVRLRVILPLLAILACLGMAVWWGLIFTQSLVVRADISSTEEDVRAKSKEHAEIIGLMNDARELELQVEQLEYYRNGVRRSAEPLAQLAEVMPVRVQLTKLSMVAPVRQNLQPPGAKVPLFGPTENVETQKLVIAGKTTKETPVMAMMESLGMPEFEDLVTKEKNINSFKQDNAQERGGQRLLSFELEYTMPGRTFAK